MQPSCCTVEAVCLREGRYSLINGLGGDGRERVMQLVVWVPWVLGTWSERMKKKEGVGEGVGVGVGGNGTRIQARGSEAVPASRAWDPRTPAARCSRGGHGGRSQAEGGWKDAVGRYYGGNVRKRRWVSDPLSSTMAGASLWIDRSDLLHRRTSETASTDPLLPHDSRRFGPGRLGYLFWPRLFLCNRGGFSRRRSHEVRCYIKTLDLGARRLMWRTHQERHLPPGHKFPIAGY
ncbi:hypothetical protein G7046_g993 [Stylonectria norvegica]|nr:hypothetical protein G7046_g993 [Stylonectria norvegica]